jgi:hypothetical protein
METEIRGVQIGQQAADINYQTGSLFLLPFTNAQTEPETIDRIPINKEHF